MAKSKNISGLSTIERVEKAKAKTEKIIDHLRELIGLHEGNRIVSYSPKLAQQIPQSYGAHAFRIFQHAMHSDLLP